MAALHPAAIFFQRKKLENMPCYFQNLKPPNQCHTTNLPAL